MRGTRYGDFSRDFDPDDRYTGVLAQQGRVQLDADWNAQLAIMQRGLRVMLGDLLAGSWAPAAEPGFRLKARGAVRFSGGERMILDESGALAPSHAGEHTVELWLTWAGGACVLLDCRDRNGRPGYRLAIEESGTLVVSPSVEQAAGTELRLFAAEPLVRSRRAHLALVIGRETVALHVDGRQVARGQHGGVARLDAPRLVFGGPIGDDAPAAGFRGELVAIRIWQTARTPAQLADSRPPAADGDQADRGLLAVWTFDRPAGSTLEDSTGGRSARIGDGGSASWSLVDLEVEPGRMYVDGVLCELAQAMSYTAQRGAPSLPGDGEYLAYLEAWEESVSPAQDPSLVEIALGGLDTSVRTSIAHRVRLHSIPPGARGDALVPPAARANGTMRARHTGQIAPGNYLYRVEIHDSTPLGGEGMATFKWSRDNGSSLFAISRPKSESVTVTYASAGVAPLGHGDVVETLPKGAALDSPAQPLLTVVSVSAADGTVKLSATPPADTALLRRWDNGAPSGDEEGGTTTGAEIPVSGAWRELDDGVHVCFEGTEFTRGDYWWIVSRMDLGSIDWPQQAGHPRALPPAGVERVTAPLARLALRDGGIEIDDLRKIIGPVAVQRAEPAVWAAPQAEPDEPPDAGQAEQAVELEDEFEQELEGELVEELEGELVPELEGELVPELEGELVPELEGGLEQEPANELEQELEDEFEGHSEPETEREPEPPGILDFDQLAALDDEPEGGQGNGPRAGSGSARANNRATTVELPEEAAAGEPRRSGGFDPARTGWSLIADLEIAGERLEQAVSSADSIILMTDKALFRLSVTVGHAEQIAPTPARRRGHRLVPLDGRLLVVGGGAEEGRRDDRLFELDVDAGTWAERKPAPIRVSGAAQATARGRLHVIGGEHLSGVRHRVGGAHHAYDPRVDRWNELPELPTPRAGAVATSLGSSIYVAGGHHDGHEHSAHVTHESYDLDAERWRAQPELPVNRLVLSSTAAHNRHVVVFADSESGAHRVTGRVAAFHPPSGRWESLADVPEGLRRPSIISHDGRILLFGTLPDGRARIHELA